MSEEEFEAEARSGGFERKQKRKSSGSTSCFDSCFGRGSKREEPPYGLETVYEESDSNFEFRPRTQLQFDEPCIAGTSYTPDTTEPPSPIARQLVIEMPPFTPIEKPIETQRVTPIGTPIKTPIETPTMTPFQQTLYYEIDSKGAPISNAKGKRVISRMHELMWIYFPDDILIDWRRQPRDTLSDGSLKPPRLSADDWRRVREERRTYPNRWDQQREANRVERSTTGIARLDSGGKAHFIAKFKEVVGRAPTEAEYMEGRDNNFGALVERMRRDRIAFTPRPKQVYVVKKPGSSDHAIAPDREMDAEDEDQSYVPSDDEETEDEVMESETDQDIWLQDVEHPTSSCRPKGRREMDAEDGDHSYVPSDDEQTEDKVMESESDQDIWLQDVEHPTSSCRPKGRMPVFSVEDAVDLLDGGEVVAKGRVVNVDPSSTLHGQTMPHGHVSLTVVGVLNGTVHIPKREEPPYGLDTVYEESDSNFQFRPRTQLQFDEPCIAGTSYTPDTTEPPSPIARQLVIETPPFTPIEKPIETQRVTPVGTPIETPIETPTMTPFQQTLYYEIDSKGAPISNAKGKRVISRMHELMWIYFPDDIFIDWRRQPRDSKQAVIDQLHREFLNPEGHRFKEKAMLHEPRTELKACGFVGGAERGSGESTHRGGVHGGKGQQLGSIAGAHEAGWHCIHSMTRTGIHSKKRPGLSDHAIAPDREMDAQDEDQSCVPSDDEETEDEVMESETDQDIWLQDVEHPASSCRPKGCREMDAEDGDQSYIPSDDEQTEDEVDILQGNQSSLLEEHFPTSILNIQVHLLVHLVDEVEIAGTVHARWMFFLERFMKTLKGFVRQRA
ncbi:hypothetical protein L7F22_034097 [Adiantum nelumboides]|nr:hypothetical protein [Adiantum nelumboides]